MQVEIKQIVTPFSSTRLTVAAPPPAGPGPCAIPWPCDAEDARLGLNVNQITHTLYTSKSQSSLTQSAWPGAPDTRHTGRGARPRPTKLRQQPALTRR